MHVCKFNFAPDGYLDITVRKKQRVKFVRSGKRKVSMHESGKPRASHFLSVPADLLHLGERKFYSVSSYLLNSMSAKYKIYIHFVSFGFERDMDISNKLKRTAGQVTMRITSKTGGSNN